MTEEIKYLSTSIDHRISTLDIEKQPANLYEPITYILSLGGKRLRPLMALLSFKLFDNDINKILDPAIGIEVFHNFTLLHDDIMDEAPLRRGKPTVHKKWDRNIAIMSGDVMLVKAYELMIKVQDDKLRKVLNAFNQCAKGVCEGQQLDMDFEEKSDVTEEEYIEMIRLKTAVLLGFSMELGAIIGDAYEKDIRSLKNFGENLGIGFQLKDDLLDVYGDHEKFGKQVGGDIIANKKTFLWIEAMKKSGPVDKSTLLSWFKRETFDPVEKVQVVTGIYDSLDIRQLAENKMNGYFSQALNILSDIDVEDEKKTQLISFAKQLIARDH